MAEAQAAAAAAAASGEGPRGGPRILTPQQRLQAFQLRANTRSVGKDGAPKRFKKPTDPDYIGGGLHAATPEMVALWERMRPLVEAHVSNSGAGGLSSWWAVAWSAWFPSWCPCTWAL